MWATADADQLKLMTDAIGNGVLMIAVCDDRRFRILSINRRIEHAIGLRHADASGHLLAKVFPEALAAQLAARYRQCVDRVERIEYEQNLDLSNGRIWWRTVLTPIADGNGNVVRLLASTTDITDRHHLEAELRQTAQALRSSERRLQLAVEGAELGIWEWDLVEQRIWMADDWAPKLQTFEGPAAISQQEWIRLVHPDQRAEAIAAGERAQRGETPSYSIEYRFHTRDGGWRWRHVHGTVTDYDDAGNPRCICGTYRDISQQKKDQEALHRLTAELEHRAAHDSLTGALNRGAILEALEKETVRAQRENTAVTVALVDADHFKAINDAYGHQAGDQVLKDLVARIRSVLRSYDHLGRYGGEEFLIVAPAMNGIDDLHERVRDAVAGAPFPTSAGAFDITVSIGVAACTGTATTAEQLILRADQALYRAKEAGRDRVMHAG